MGKGATSDASSKTSTVTTTNTKNLNLQGVQGTQVFTEGKVNVTDGGAIKGSLAIGKDAVSAVVDISNAFLEANQELNERAIGLTENVAAGIEGYAGKVTDLAQSAATDDTAETIQTLVKWGAATVAVIAAAYYFSKVKK